MHNRGFLIPRMLAYAVLVLVALALLVSSLLWQKLNNIQEELAKRSLDSGAQAIEARTLAKAAQDRATSPCLLAACAEVVARTLCDPQP